MITPERWQWRWNKENKLNWIAAFIVKLLNLLRYGSSEINAGAVRLNAI